MNPLESFFLFIHKPVGATSQQCLTKFKKKYGYKKVGHHGTLDPFATGLLLVGVNEATKFFPFIDDKKKSYEATLCLGVKTDTLDCTGQVIAQDDVPVLTAEDIKQATKKLIGKIQQTPPMYSAIKKDGKRLYELAREGKEIKRQSREVEIFDLQIKQWNSPELKIFVTVSRGTYIRVLAEQIAKLFATHAHLTQLVRTKLCHHDLSHAISLDADVNLENYKISIADMLTQYDAADLSQQSMTDIFHGKPIPIDAIKREGQSSSKLRAFYQDQFLGILENRGQTVHSARLMNPGHFL